MYGCVVFAFSLAVSGQTGNRPVNQRAEAACSDRQRMCASAIYCQPGVVDVGPSKSTGSLAAQSTDANRESHDENGSVFNYCVTHLDRNQACTGHRDESETVPPAVAAVSSRTVEPFGRIHEQRYYSSNAERFTEDQGVRYEYWVDRLLDIPVEEFIQIDSTIMQSSNDAYKRAIDLAPSDKYAAQLKAKWLLNKTVYDWQTKQDRAKTKEQLISLQEYCKEQLLFCVFLENWVLMKTLKDILHNKPVDRYDKQHLLLNLNRMAFDWRDKTKVCKTIDLQFLDLLSIAAFYFMGALPGFKDAANYDIGLILMNRQCESSERYYHLYSPVSFTIFDYLRFSPADLCVKLNEQHKTLQFGQTGRLMWMIVILASTSGMNITKCGKTGDFLTWISSNMDNVDCHPFVIIIESLINFNHLLRAIEQKTVKTKQIEAYIKDITTIINLPKRTQQIIYGDSIGLFYHLKSVLIKIVSKHKPRFTFAQLAKLFESAEKVAPNHCYSTYYYYHQAGMWQPAAAAASRYATYLAGENHQLLAEYWSGLSDRELMLAEEQGMQSKISEQHYDIDAIIQAFSAMPEGEAESVSHKPKSKKQRKKNNKQASTSNGNHSGSDVKKPTEQSLTDTGPKPSECSSAIKKFDSTHYRPIIRAVPYGANLSVNMPDDEPYQIKSKQSAIRPFEKLLSRHWNPLVKKTLGLIKAARLADDMDRECEIYHRILGNPQLKACIGIERIWEEYAWTKLHELDDCFRLQAVPGSKRQTAKQWIDHARSYLIPCFAYCLELDQINARISPEAVWEAVTSLVEQPELAEPADNREIRFRFRCLFSSMGHTCSLEAMLESENPGKADHLSIEARKWYGYKTIDRCHDTRKSVAALT